MKSKNNYIPIDCNYYDRLEAWATLSEKVEIIYLEGGRQKSISGIIKDLFILEKVEFLKLNDGTTIRLDHLKSVNGIEVPSGC